MLAIQDLPIMTVDLSLSLPGWRQCWGLRGRQSHKIEGAQALE